MVHIRSAEKNQAKILTNLAIESESYWGFDTDFMKKFEEIFRITEDFLSKNTTFVVFESDAIIGFYSIIKGEENSLEYFYIAPLCIGKGYGQIMFEHMKKHCQKNGITDIFLVTSPQAKGFYEKMGAIQVAEVESLLEKGRVIPKLMFNFL